MRKRTKGLRITPSVKDAVFARDGRRCVLCYSWMGSPCAHYISRAQGGLGIEENIVTLCPECHRAYDQSTDRAEIREELRRYLKSKYKDWDESKLVYKKGM